MRTLATLLVALLVPLAVLADPNSDDLVNNPPFASWSSFPLGTTVTQKETVMLADGRRIDQTFTFKLLEKTADHVVVEMARTDVSPGSGEAEKVVTTYPAKVKKGQVDTPRSALVSLKEGEAEIDGVGRARRGGGVAVAGPCDRTHRQRSHALGTARAGRTGQPRRRATRMVAELG